jgi:HD-like signal output (HDOD) protein
MDIKTLTDRPAKLPAVSGVAQKIIASFGTEDISVSDISRTISADPGLSAKLLWLANSAYFQVSKTIGTVDGALQMLGFVMVRNLVLGNSLARAFDNACGMDLKKFWRYNLYTACASRWLASRLGINTDFVFTLGLMHGIGQLQLHAVAPAAMTTLDQQVDVLDAQRPKFEVMALGFHYGEVSAELAKAWNFPPVLVDALRLIPEPLASPTFLPAAACVHLGAWRARVDVLGFTPAGALSSYPSEVAAKLGIGREWAKVDETESASLRESTAMPALKELSVGLEELFA